MENFYLPEDNASKFKLLSNPAQIEKDLRTFSAQLKGIIADEDVRVMEMTYVSNWFEDRKHFYKKAPYGELLKLLENAFEDGELTQEEILDLIWYCDNYTEHDNQKYGIIASGIQRLTGIVDGMVCDEHLDVKDVQYLMEWLNDNEQLKNIWPYDEVYSLVLKIMQDDVLTKEEHDELVRFGRYVVTGTVQDSDTKLGAFLQIDPEIRFEGKVFCFTGNSLKARRRDMEKLVAEYGGRCVQGVSKELDYLVVCQDESRCWAYSCYGRKIEQGQTLRRNGAKLVMVSELDFWDAVEGER